MYHGVSLDEYSPSVQSGASVGVVSPGRGGRRDARVGGNAWKVKECVRESWRMDEVGGRALRERKWDGDPWQMKRAGTRRGGDGGHAMCSRVGWRSCVGGRAC